MARLHRNHLSARVAHPFDRRLRGIHDRSQPTTEAPSRANVSAVARPMIPPVPVTTQTFPDSRPDIYPPTARRRVATS